MKEEHTPTTVAQVGGTHYQAKTQHWDLMERWDIDYLAGNATAYILRFDRKGTPRQDLEKAKSYLEKMLEGKRGTRRLVPFAALEEFYNDNKMDAGKRRLYNLILEGGTEAEIMSAIMTLLVMIVRYPE